MKIFFIDDKLENGKIKGFHHKLDGCLGYSRIAEKIDLYKQLKLKSPIYTNCPMLLLQAENENVFFWTGYSFENKKKLIDKNKVNGDKTLFQMFIDGDIQHALKKDWRY